MDKWVIGVDLGGTKIRFGLVSPDNTIVAVRQIPTNDHEGIIRVVARMGEAIDELATHRPAGATLAAVGVCSPGPVDHEAGVLHDPPNLPGLHNTPLRDLLSDRLGVPVTLEHDAKAAALGDFHYGAGRGARDMIFVVVGTGVGAAIIFDGQIYRGRHNSAGEIGHTTLDLNGDRCNCGGRGCVETFMSGPWLGRHYERALVAAKQPPRTVNGEEVAHLARDGDPLALEVMEHAGTALGAAIATMAMMVDVDLFVIGGSVAKSGDLLLEPARHAAPKYSHASVGKRIRILQTAAGDDGPILGCAWLARQL
ncbi:MAG: ROK family protein [Anaerolineales bacterium]|nr:ROK family protein [Anaerolineales bacterium]